MIVLSHVEPVRPYAYTHIEGKEYVLALRYQTPLGTPRLAYMTQARWQRIIQIICQEPAYLSHGADKAQLELVLHYAGKRRKEKSACVRAYETQGQRFSSLIYLGRLHYELRVEYQLRALQTVYRCMAGEEQWQEIIQRVSFWMESLFLYELKCQFSAFFITGKGIRQACDTGCTVPFSSEQQKRWQAIVEWLKGKMFVPQEVHLNKVCLYCMGIDTEPAEDEALLQRAAVSRPITPPPATSAPGDVSAEVDWSIVHLKRHV
jgi:hypothetical protein